MFGSTVINPKGEPLGEKQKRSSNEIQFKAAYKKNGEFLLSNFYGGAEFDYMILKFDIPGNEKVVALFQRWKVGDYGEAEDFHSIRHKLERQTVTCLDTLVPKSGQSGEDWTDRQRQSYEAEYQGATFVGNGILMKLAASVWKNKDRKQVLEHLAGMEQGTMKPPLNLYHWVSNEDPSLFQARDKIIQTWGLESTNDPKKAVEILRKESMVRALQSKFKEGSIYRNYLLGTDDKVLKEAGNDPVFGSGRYMVEGTGEQRDCQNLLGKLLMELRTSLSNTNKASDII